MWKRCAAALDASRPRVGSELHSSPRNGDRTREPDATRRERSASPGAPRSRSMNAKTRPTRIQGVRTIDEILATPPIYPIPLVERDGAHIVFYEVDEHGSKNEVYDIPVSGVQDDKEVAF